MDPVGVPSLKLLAWLHGSFTDLPDPAARLGPNGSWCQKTHHFQGYKPSKGPEFYLFDCREESGIWKHVFWFWSNLVLVTSSIGFLAPNTSRASRHPAQARQMAIGPWPMSGKSTMSSCKKTICWNVGLQWPSTVYCLGGDQCGCGTLGWREWCQREHVQYYTWGLDAYDCTYIYIHKCSINIYIHITICIYKIL